MPKITFCEILSNINSVNAADLNRSFHSRKQNSLVTSFRTLYIHIINNLNIFKKSVFYPSETGAGICTDKHCQYKIQICRLNRIVYPVNIMLCSLGDRNSVKVKENCSDNIHNKQMICHDMVCIFSHQSDKF